MKISENRLAAQGDPAADPRAFRNCLGQFVTGVTVVSAAHDGILAGVTCNSFSSVSLDPPLVLWSLRKNSTSAEVFRGSKHFAVNVLAAPQIHISQRFAVSGGAKFDGIDHSFTPDGSPMIDGCAAIFECVREAEHDGGDHYIIIGKVTRFSRFEQDPLVFRQGHYAAAIDHPGPPLAYDRSAEARGKLWTIMLRQAYTELNKAIDSLRVAVGLTTNQARLLSLAEEFPGRSVEELVSVAFIAPRAGADTMAALKDMGYVDVREGTLWVTEAGSKVLSDLFANVARLEESLLANFSEEQVQTAFEMVRTMTRLAGDRVNATHYPASHIERSPVPN